MNAVIVDCNARVCAWNEDGKCRAPEIRIQVRRYGAMSCWTYTDVRERQEQETKEG